MIVNCTPHPINLFRESDCHFEKRCRKLLLKDTAEPVKVLEPSGVVLSAKITFDFIRMIDGISIYRAETKQLDILPVAFGLNCYFVVSRQYVAAAKIWNRPTDKLMVISQPVYLKREIRPCGCLGLEKVK